MTSRECLKLSLEQYRNSIDKYKSELELSKKRATFLENDASVKEYINLLENPRVREYISEKKCMDALSDKINAEETYISHIMKLLNKQ